MNLLFVDRKERGTADNGVPSNGKPARLPSQNESVCVPVSYVRSADLSGEFRRLSILCLNCSFLGFFLLRSLNSTIALPFVCRGKTAVV